MHRLPLHVLHGIIVLCVSAIGCPDAFIHSVQEVFPPFLFLSLCLQTFVLVLPILKYGTMVVVRL